MIPKYAFELMIYGRDGRVQVREFETVGTALATAQTLRASIVNGWRLVIVIETKTLREQNVMALSERRKRT